MTYRVIDLFENGKMPAVRGVAARRPAMAYDLAMTNSANEQKRFDVVAVLGSLRKDSSTRKFVTALSRLAPPSLSIRLLDITDLKMYNPDEEATMPEAWTRFREEVRRADAVLFGTPEYNRSIPGCLKNAIDVGSRPYAQNAWRGKPAAIISGSPGAMGGFGANHHLRQTLVAVGMPAMAQPEAYVGGVDKLLDAAGEIVKNETREFGTLFLGAFESWIKVVKGQQ